MNAPVSAKPQLGTVSPDPQKPFTELGFGCPSRLKLTSTIWVENLINSKHFDSQKAQIM